MNDTQDTIQADEIDQDQQFFLQLVARMRGQVGQNEALAREIADRLANLTQSLRRARIIMVDIQYQSVHDNVINLLQHIEPNIEDDIEPNVEEDIEPNVEEDIEPNVENSSNQRNSSENSPLAVPPGLEHDPFAHADSSKSDSLQRRASSSSEQVVVEFLEFVGPQEYNMRRNRLQEAPNRPENSSSSESEIKSEQSSPNNILFSLLGFATMCAVHLLL